MGLDAYVFYPCIFRPEGQLHVIQQIRTRVALLQIARERGLPTISYETRVGDTTKTLEFTREELEKSATLHGELLRACGDCEASFRKALGHRAEIGCYARVNYPLDERAQQVLFETLQLNATPGDFKGPEGQFIRDLLADTSCTGKAWENLCARLDNPPSPIASRPVAFPVEGPRNTVTVNQLCEKLFFEPRLTWHQTRDRVEFFRSFYGVVAGHVLTNGEIDDRKNDAFWGSSPSLQELNLYAKALKGAIAVLRGMVQDG